MKFKKRSKFFFQILVAFSIMLTLFPTVTDERIDLDLVVH